MSILVNKKGQPCYTIENKLIKVYITLQGGHLTADFNCNGENIDPFFYAPWSAETKQENIDWILHILRGDPFCFPFGSGKEPYQGKKYSHHGKTANDLWDFMEIEELPGKKRLKLVIKLDNNEGSVEKAITLTDKSPLIYDQHTINNFFGKTSLGHHHIFHLPYDKNSAIVDLSKPIAGFTPPIPAYHPREGDGIESGYSWIKHNQSIEDLSRVECIDGSWVDLSHFPIPKGYAEIILFVSDPKRDFCYSAISVPKKGFCYFQLKDPRILSSTMFWISNGGQYNLPSQRKIDSVLALEEVTGYFHFGREKSVSSNPLSKKGYKTYISINDLLKINMIYGVFPISKDFKGIKDIIKKDEQTIQVVGKKGEKIDIPCFIDFLFQGDFQ